MAKIDTSKIEGYSAMSAEEKLAILEGLDINDGTSEIENYKRMISKANTEAAEWKRKHNALLTEDEKAKAEKDAAFEAMKERVETLEREKTEATFTAKLTSIGYDGKLAMATAKALAEGKMDVVFANMKQHGETKEQALRAEILKSTPTPQAAGSASTAMTAEEIRAITDPAERQQKIAENITLFQ